MTVSAHARVRNGSNCGPDLRELLTIVERRYRAPAPLRVAISKVSPKPTCQTNLPTNLPSEPAKRTCQINLGGLPLPIRLP